MSSYVDESYNLIVLESGRAIEMVSAGRAKLSLFLNFAVYIH